MKPEKKILGQAQPLDLGESRKHLAKPLEDSAVVSHSEMMLELALHHVASPAELTSKSLSLVKKLDV